MALILLEALGALALLVLIVWWTMFSGRDKGELRGGLKGELKGELSDALKDETAPATAKAPLPRDAAGGAAVGSGGADTPR